MSTMIRSARALSRLGRALALVLASAAVLGVPGASAAVSAPAAGTEGVSGVTFSSAILHGNVNAHGAATDYFFQYGTSRGYGAQTPLAPVGNGTIAVKVTQGVTGLKPATTYHYRIVASSAAGVVNGGDRSFTTPKVPLSLQIAGVPNPVAFGAPFFVEGTLSGTGAASHEVVLQANPFPYLAGFANVGNPEITNASGGFSFAYVGLLQNAQLRVVTVGKPLVVSPVLVEGVAVRVSFHVRRAHRRGFVRFYGSVAPAEVGALVGFQLLKPGHRSVNVGGTAVRGGSRFSNLARRRRGVYRALVKVNDGAHVSAYSAPILIR